VSSGFGGTRSGPVGVGALNTFKPLRLQPEINRWPGRRGLRGFHNCGLRKYQCANQKEDGKTASFDITRKILSSVRVWGFNPPLHPSNSVFEAPPLKVAVVYSTGSDLPLEAERRAASTARNV